MASSTPLRDLTESFFKCTICLNQLNHHQRILRLGNIEAKELTLETLSTLTENPRCHEHVKKEAHLCCVTCDNVPVCITCTYNKHKGHDLHDVTEQAEIERDQLNLKLVVLNLHKRKLYELPKKTKKSKQQLLDIASKKTEKLNNQYKQQVERLKAKIEKSKVVRLKGFADIESKRTKEESHINRNYKEEFKELNKKYDRIRKTCITKYDNELRNFKKNRDEIDREFFRKLGQIDSNWKSLTTAKDLLTEHKMNDLQKISDYCEQIIRRYEDLTTTASSILDCNDEWTDVQCIPDVKTSCESLIDEIKKEFPELESLSDIVIDDITNVSGDEVTISEHEESVVYVEGIKAKGWKIDGISNCTDGNIVISGTAGENLSHISVINKIGEIQRQQKIKTKSTSWSYRFCCYLSDYKVATACRRDEIGIFDVRDGSYKKKYISEMICSWPSHQCVWSVATDAVNNHIIVGTDSRYVYVFDDQMNYSHTITLPDVIKISNDITVHKGYLLTCDSFSKRAHAVSMGGSDGQLIYEFTKPDLDRVNWRPISVCTDKNNFIYMLRRDKYNGERYILTQYSQNGQNLLTTKEVALGAEHVITVEDDGSEKLLVASEHLGTVHTYSLIAT